jgi:hypothetical protein
VIAQSAETLPAESSEAVSSQHDEPYVGARPFDERERDRFFGRDEEARLLVNKILTVPVTVVFAASGIGKSSILRTLVVPALRKLEAKVVYFDDWTSEPVSALRNRVLEEVGALSRSEFVREEATLLELTRALNEEREESLVLVLDQFEQFFVRHGDALDGLARELGALARSGVDGHVVIVLREEYLARLEAFRDHWLTLAPARYRLRPLPADKARQAIERPLERFQGGIEPELVEELLVAFSVRGASVGLVDEGDVGGVSLPILQIVCLYLWRAIKGEPERQITKALYQALGGRQGIVDAYVRDAFVDTTAADRLVLARMLNLLAPKAGVKMAYPVDLLAEQVGLSTEEVGSLLARLEKQRIVHFRDEGRVVELTHDAFTAVLRSFIEEELQAERARKAAEDLLTSRRRKRWRLFGWGAIATVALLVGVGYQKRQELANERNELRAALGAQDCGKLTAAVRGLRSRADRSALLTERVSRWLGGSPLDDLFTGLERNASVAAACNGPRSPASELGNLQSGAHFTLALNQGGGKARPIQLESMRQLWRELSDRLWTEKRVRISPVVDVELDERLPQGTFVLKIEDRVMLRRSLPKLDDRLAILAINSPASLESEVSEVETEIGFERRELSTFDERHVFAGFAKPWSAPLWRVIDERLAASVPVNAEAFALELLPAVEAAVTFEAFENVARNPELYLTESLTEGLLVLRSNDDPCLVRAAAARFRGASSGEGPSDLPPQLVSRVHRTLLESARRGRSAGVLTRILDRIADLDPTHPDAVPVRVAAWVIEDGGRARPTENVRFTHAGSWECKPFKLAQPMGDMDYRAQVAYSLDEEEEAFRVGVGRELVRRLTPGAQLGTELIDGLRDLRLGLYRSYGIYLRSVTFQQEAWQDDRFRIDLPGDERHEPERAAAAASLLRAVDERAREARFATITPFDTQWLVSDGLRKWLETRFSRNDVKLILRSVLAKLPPAPSGRTPNLPWLLGSLPVWAEVCGQQDAACLIRRLSETEIAARERGPSDGASRSPAVAATVQALANDRYELAIESFVIAFRGDQDGAIREFSRAYANASDELFLARVQRDFCTVPTPGRGNWAQVHPSQLTEIELALDLEAARADQKLAANLRLCALMRKLPASAGGDTNAPGNAAATAARIQTFLREHAADERSWTAAQRFWVGDRLLLANAGVGSVDPRPAEVSRAARATAIALLTASFTTSGDALPFPDDAFVRLLQTCSITKSDRCSWDLATLAEKAKLSYRALSALADALSRLPTQGALEHLLSVRQLWQRVGESLPSDLPARERSAYALWLRTAQGSVDVHLLSHQKGDPAELALGLERLRVDVDGDGGMAPHDKAELGLQATSLLWDAYEYAGRHADGERLIPNLVKAGGMRELGALFRAGNVAGAAAKADDMLDRGVGEPSEVLFISALSHLLLDDGDEFRRSADQLLYWMDHRYRDYVRLMLSWRLRQRGHEAAARMLLEDRLREVSREETPEQRLSEGDLAPWREMLIRYSLAPTDAGRALVFGPLRDESAFGASVLAKGGQSLSSFRCEAYFYDALLQSVTADASTRQSRYHAQLQAVMREGCYSMYEYQMARWLMGRK